ncbi:hypothetical protein [Cesiribacter sp. SM1]|uniref:hypothetical protein n=1 Tax=Cesiribacter sp. SM1 TaxID=2861196 RepID=UPI001CD4D9A9|nr:hypothetical protein [Cesiribacter sp. SM1]
MDQESTLLDIFLYLGYFLVIIAVAAAIILPLIKSLDHPQSLIKVAGGFILLLVIFGISYALSSGDLAARYPDLTEQGSKLVGGALITMYILIVLAVLGIAVTEVSKYFR